MFVIDEKKGSKSMKKKVLTLFVVVAIMFTGIVVVSASSSVQLNVTSSTVVSRNYSASKAYLASTITSNGHGAGTPGTYIRAYLFSGNTYVQKLGFKQDVGQVGYVSVQRGYVGVGSWLLRLYGKNQETGLSYADWSGYWMYSDVN